MSKTIYLLLFFSVLYVKAGAQEGEKSIAAGLLVAVSDNSSTTQFNRYEYSWGTGVGVEVTGQSNFTDRSAVLLQFQLTRFTGSSSFTSLLYNPVITPVSVKGGYRYQLTSSGFYANGLLGLEFADHDTYLPLALGVGKRMAIKDKFFIDAGIDFAGGFVSRFNIKAIIGLRKKKN